MLTESNKARRLSSPEAENKKHLLHYLCENTQRLELINYQFIQVQSQLSSPSAYLLQLSGPWRTAYIERRDTRFTSQCRT